MTTEDILELFFSRNYEKQLNKMMLEDREYSVPKDGVFSYVVEVIGVPYEEYIKYITNHLPSKNIESRNLTQSSSFVSCEIDMVRALLSVDNPGLTAMEVGELFPEKVGKPNRVSLTKYGENQSKTAEQLGLTFEYYKHWYLNCIGYVYEELNGSERQSLLARTLLRDPLYHRIIADLQYQDVDLVTYMAALSDETKLRRYESIATLVDICVRECRVNGINTYKVLDTKQELAQRVKAAKTKKKNEVTLIKQTQDAPLLQVAEDIEWTTKKS